MFHIFTKKMEETLDHGSHTRNINKKKVNLKKIEKKDWPILVLSGEVENLVLIGRIGTHYYCSTKKERGTAMFWTITKKMEETLDYGSELRNRYKKKINLKKIEKKGWLILVWNGEVENLVLIGRIGTHYYCSTKLERDTAMFHEYTKKMEETLDHGSSVSGVKRRMENCCRPERIGFDLPELKWWSG